MLTGGIRVVRQEFSGRKRFVMELVEKLPKGATVFKIGGGPFIAENPATDRDLFCGRCGRLIAAIPSSVELRGPSGLVIFACEACGANNVSPPRE
jgi:hypothetical protein